LKNKPLVCYEHIPESLLTILKRLADGGFLKNNRQWIVCQRWTRGPWLNQVIRSMSNLEKVHLECNLTLTEDLPQLFRSCPTLAELRVRLFDPSGVERERFKRMNEDFKNELRSGFQKLRRLELDGCIDLCSEFQEIFTQVQRRQYSNSKTLIQ
jgi:hypothetical protein